MRCLRPLDVRFAVRRPCLSEASGNELVLFLPQTSWFEIGSSFWGFMAVMSYLVTMVLDWVDFRYVNLDILKRKNTFSFGKNTTYFSFKEQHIQKNSSCRDNLLFLIVHCFPVGLTNKTFTLC